MKKLAWIAAYLLVALAVMLMGVKANEAAAQSPYCGVYALFKKTLAENYSEFPTARALSKNDTIMVELFISKAGTFTIIATPRDGPTCIIAAGKKWTAIAPEIEGTPL